MAESSSLLLAANDYFFTEVEEAFLYRKITSSPLAKHYLVKLLMHYMNASNLFDETTEKGTKTRSTLAEMYLKAVNEENDSLKSELLKKLGDTSLYITGFFAESLNREVIDVDYYVEMGGSAYSSLSKIVNDESYQELFDQFALNFVNFVDVLNVIAQKSLIHTNENLLKLYENYLKTGSKLTQEKLIQKGFDFSSDLKKVN